MRHNENITPEEYETILRDGKFLRTEEDEDGNAIRVFCLNGKEFKVY